MKQYSMKVPLALEICAVVGRKTTRVGTCLKGFLTKAKREVRIVPEGSVIENILDIIAAAVGGGAVVNVAQAAVLGHEHHSWVS